MLVTPTKTYDPPAVDMWAAGVVLYCMLVGTMPWLRADKGCCYYLQYYASRRLNAVPSTPMWQRLSTRPECGMIHMYSVYSVEVVHAEVLTQLLEPNPDMRIKSVSIFDIPWMQSSTVVLNDQATRKTRSSVMNKRIRQAAQQATPARIKDATPRAARALPVPRCPPAVDTKQRPLLGGECFTQPACTAEQVLLNEDIMHEMSMLHQVSTYHPMHICIIM